MDKNINPLFCWTSMYFSVCVFETTGRSWIFFWGGACSIKFVSWKPAFNALRVSVNFPQSLPSGPVSCIFYVLHLSLTSGISALPCRLLDWTVASSFLICAWLWCSSSSNDLAKYEPWNRRSWCLNLSATSPRVQPGAWIIHHCGCRKWF